MNQTTGAFRSDYAAKLASDEWRQFSDRVKQDRGEFCECCKRGDKRLEVHHIAYRPDLEPWEHPHEDLAVLCHGCHQALHIELINFRRFVFRRFDPNTFRVFNGALAVGLDEHDPLTLAYAFASLVSSPGSISRFAGDWKPPPSHHDPSGEADVSHPTTA